MNMKRFLRLAFWLVILASLVVAVRGRAQETRLGEDKWVGVWQGQLEGVPGVTLTLGNDSGTVEGTIVFTALGPGSTREHPNIVAHEVHSVSHAKAEGDTLTFQVKMPGRNSDAVEMVLSLTGEASGTLRCSKCGSAPPTEMTKLK